MLCLTVAFNIFAKPESEYLDEEITDLPIKSMYSSNLQIRLVF